MRQLLAGCVVLGFLGSASAQEPSSAPQETGREEPEKVLAQMKEYRLSEEDLEHLLELVPESSRQQLAAPERRRQFVKSWMEIMVFYQEALSQGLEKNSEFQDRLEFFKKQILVEHFREHLLSDVTVNETEVEEFYTTNRERFRVPPKVRASHILLSSREEAQKVREALDRGESFEELTQDHSLDRSSREEGGELGWIEAGRAVPEFEQAAFALEPGAYSNPVETQFGWHIIRVSEKREAEYSSLDEVRGPLTEQLLNQKRRELLDDISADLFKKYEVKLH